MRHSDIEASYPEFKAIYRSHLGDAKFDNALSTHSDFLSLKLRLVSARHLLENNWRLGDKTRAALVNSLLEDDFNRTEQILQDDKKSMLSTFASFFRSTKRVKPLKVQMRALAERLPDSDFLLEIKAVEDKDLQPTIKSIEALAYTILSPLIDKTVGSMTHAVAEMQKEHCRRSIQHEIESEEMDLRSAALANFIQEFNAQRTRQRDS